MNTASLAPRESCIGATAARGPVISMMLAVPDAPAAVAWYKRALGAAELWNLGSVVGLEIGGAPFFIGQPENNGWDTPQTLRSTTLRIELFCDDPDAVIERAVREGAVQGRHAIRNHEMPWGTHRQGGFVDPFGHVWFVGDRSPLPDPRRAHFQRRSPMNRSKWIRQIHRWLSVVFTVAVIVTFIALAQETPVVWVSYLPLLPLALLWFTGLYLFVLPYASRWRGARRTNMDQLE